MPDDVLPSPRRAITVCDSREALLRAAAELVVTLAERAISGRGRFDWALAGGNTPRALYALLASDAFAGRIDWGKVHIYWGDERCVPPTDAASNYRMAKETLLDAVPLPHANVHRMHGELEPTTAAASYEELLRSELAPRDGRAPRLDLVLLGMGADGHTASLFPGTTALAETQRWVVANHVESLDAWRLTLTLPLLNSAAHVAFLVEGKAKAARVAEVLRTGPSALGALPAQRVAPASGSLQWLLDSDAASLLEP